jgi:hypothetical protein
MTLDTTASALNTNPSIDQHPGGRHARLNAPDHTEGLEHQQRQHRA